MLISAVYFVQGAVGITGMAEFILTRNYFHFSWIQLAFLGSLATLAWCIKPLYGFVTDFLPLFGLRRKPYILIASLLTVSGYLMLGLFATNFHTIIMASILISVGLGFSDVIIDGLVIESSDKETVGKYQALCWRAKAFGILLASLFSGYLLERAFFSKHLLALPFTQWLMHTFPKTIQNTLVSGINILDIRYLFLFTAVLPLVVVIISLAFREEKVIASNRGAHYPLAYIFGAVVAFAATALVVIAALTTKPWIAGIRNETLSSLLVMIIWMLWIGSYFSYLIKNKMASSTLFLAATFLFLWRFTPSFGAPWSNYFLNTLALSKEKLGFIATITSLGWIIGSFIYNKYLDKYEIKKLLYWTVIIGVGLSFTQLIVATPALATKVGSFFVIKYSAAILLYPVYLFGYGTEAWNVLMSQPAILNIDAVLSFLLEIMFIISFLPLLKLAALVTPKGVEATNFSLLTSIMNLGLAFGTISGGIIYTYIEGQYKLAGISFNGLHLTIIIGALTSLLCLLVLKRLVLTAENKN